jgi:hypothetical protein
MPHEEYPCDDGGTCVADPGAKGEISSCIYCGKELIKIDGMWYTWDCDFHPKQKPQI